MTAPATRTTCPYCGVGCGVIATPQTDGSVAVTGDPDHPANFGRLCSKGLALGETLAGEGRLLHPEIAGQRTDWDSALDLVAQRFTETITEYGPESVAFYVSGQLLTEDYYVANKLMKGYIGTANIDTNSRLCMASSVAGHRRAFGSDTVPGTYADLDEADCVVLVGSNLAWCHPVLFQRLLAAREARGTRIIVIDPRRTATAEAADLHLPLAPDSDVALFAGLLGWLDRHGHRDVPFRARLQDAGAVEAARSVSIADVARHTGLPEADIQRFYTLFAATEHVVTVYSQGVNQSVRGTDKVNAILNCHLVTGRIGRPGMGPFSVTGQPNAMGGREVGGLANMLAAHMNIEDAAARDRVQRFWASPAMAQKPGLKAVDLFAAVAAGTIKALWIIGTNPAVSMPEANGIRNALELCPFVVVSDVMRQTDTTRFADVLLPAAAWGEKNGTVTNSERRISRQRAFRDLPGGARTDWAILADIARRMGFSGFDYAGPDEIFAEHAALSGFENHGSRDFDISAHAVISTDAYNALAPFHWPYPAGGQPRERLFADGRFYTANGRAHLQPTPVGDPPERRDVTALTLNTGRIRDQWHTMTRTGAVPRLMGQFGEPFCEINPADAARLGIEAAALLRLDSAFGTTIARALTTDRQPRGSVFVPMHWTGQFASGGRANALTLPRVDPVSGQPGLKNVPVSLTPAIMGWYGLAVSATKPDAQHADYWALSPVPGGYRLECAGQEMPQDWQAHAASLLQVPAGADWVAFHDTASGGTRLAAFVGETCVAALFVARQPVEVSRSFLAEALLASFPTSGRFRLLAGRGGADRPDVGALICACNSVGANQIIAAVHAGHASVEAVGQACNAGTGCGSCRSDIRRIIDAERFEKAG